MAYSGLSGAAAVVHNGIPLASIKMKRGQEFGVTETVAAIVAAHRARTTSPAETVARSFARIRSHNDPAVFISLREE